MSRWQRCPICGGNGIDPWCVASTAVPTRFSNPCHRCNGSGTIIEPDTRPRCVDCGKTAGWFGLHLCNTPADDEDLRRQSERNTNEPPWKF